MNLEKHLADALRRKQPAPGMVERVMARINARERPSVPVAAPWRVDWPALRIAAGLVLVVLLGAAVLQQRQAQREREQGEFAKQQLITALQIASETLNEAQKMVQQQ